MVIAWPREEDRRPVLFQNGRNGNGEGTDRQLSGVERPPAAVCGQVELSVDSLPLLSLELLPTRSAQEMMSRLFRKSVDGLLYAFLRVE